MLDIKLIRERQDIVINDLKKRGANEKIKLLDKLVKEDEDYRKLLKDLENLRHERNKKTQDISKLKREGKNISKSVTEMKKLITKMKTLEDKVTVKKELTESILYQIPNILDKTVPKGESDEDNKVVSKWGKKPSIKKPKGHEEIATNLDILDIKRASRISGARFFFLKNQGVLLDMALQKFAIDFLQNKGFSLTQPPFLMRKEPYKGVVDLGDFEDVMYKIEDEDLYLIATSEHPLVAQYQNETLNQDNLPIKMAGISTCFRKEAGSHGKDTKGIFRVHQFNKIEQLVICEPKESWLIHEKLLKNTETLFKKLELPYRIVNVCTGDIGSIAAKKYDLEVWMPVQKKYREAASCSNATDYQARRLRIKYGKKDAKATGLVHTINNTALATSRVIVAILENYQQPDGSVLIPRVLRPYMNGMKKIEK